MELLSKAMELGADFVDVEFGSQIVSNLINNRNKTSSKIIMSYHDFKETPSLEKLESIYNQINKLNPDFVKVAEACGVTSFRVNKKEEVVPALEKALAHNGPALVHCKVAKQDNVYPMVPAGNALDQVMDMA